MLLVETFHSRVIEMRKLQLDDIAIPCFGVLDIFVVREGREGGPETAKSVKSHRRDRARTAIGRYSPPYRSYDYCDCSRFMSATAARDSRNELGHPSRAAASSFWAEIESLALS